MALLLHKWYSKAASLINYSTQGHVHEPIQLLQNRKKSKYT